VEHLVFASSSSVYGGNAKLPYSERDAVDHPISYYAATKKANEVMAHSYAHLYGLPTTGLRFFTVYGPWGRPDMALFKFTRAMLAGEPIDVYGHGKSPSSAPATSAWFPAAPAWRAAWVGRQRRPVPRPRPRQDHDRSGSRKAASRSIDAGPAGDGEAQRRRAAACASPPTSRGAWPTALIQFIAVGTPPDEDGSADLQIRHWPWRATSAAHDRLQGGRRQSTVPVGTADKVGAASPKSWRARRRHRLQRGLQPRVPEGRRGRRRLHEARPHRRRHRRPARRAQLMRELYAPFQRNHDRLIVMDVRSAELTKYAANAMLATRISFMNELANLAERWAPTSRRAPRHRQRPAHRLPLPLPRRAGYGGSCFPKDVKALIHTARRCRASTRGAAGGGAANDAQKRVLAEDRWRATAATCRARPSRCGAWPSSPTPTTCARRPAACCIKALLGRRRHGARLRPGGHGRGRRIFGDEPDLTLCDSRWQALEGADALVIVTEWKTSVVLRKKRSVARAATWCKGIPI
jgi:UDPglucose 6-dehydrogenase